MIGGRKTHRQACLDSLLLLFGSSDPILLTISNMRTDCILEILIIFKIVPESNTKDWNRNNTQLRVWASYVSHLMLQHLFHFARIVITKGKSLLRQAHLPTDFSDKITENCLLCVHVRSGKNTSERTAGHHNVAAFGQCAQEVEKEMVKTCPRKVAWIVISDMTKVGASL